MRFEMKDKMTQTDRHGNSINLATAHIIRRCPYCGCKLYEKLGRCDGTIQIKCPKCGKQVNMNLALRKARMK